MGESIASKRMRRNRDFVLGFHLFVKVFRSQQLKRLSWAWNGTSVPVCVNFIVPGTPECTFDAPRLLDPTAMEQALNTLRSCPPVVSELAEACNCLSRLVDEGKRTS